MKILIIEDEEFSALKLKQLLHKINPQIQVVDVLNTVQKSIQFFKQKTEIDLLFLDIELADGSGLELLKQIEIFAPIIFTTAYAQYSLDAFKHYSVDYLLKPIDVNELKASLDKFQMHYQMPQTTLSNSAKLPQRLLAHKGKGKYPIHYKDIAYFYYEDKIVWLITHDSTSYYVNYTLDHLEQNLPDKFFRANRKVIVQVAAINWFETLPKSKIKLHLQPAPNFEVSISSEKSAVFKNWILNIED